MLLVRCFSFALLAVIATSTFAGAPQQGPHPRPSTRELAHSVSGVNTNADFAKLVAELRSRGPESLEEVLRAHRELKHSAESQRKFQRLITEVAGQRDAFLSRLFWYTDLDEAKAAAAEAGKPILSLRMLGKLTDEYSCANSRFFRTALYANKEISDYLRENYILHWQSVRPVPRVTIDFGDGRTLERTITGNSAHYVLDAAGRPLDVLPGLYGPRGFLDWLKQWERQSRELAETAPTSRDEMLVYCHATALGGLESELERELRLVAPEELRSQLVRLGRDEEAAALSSDALEAGSRATAKTAAEAPIVREVLPDDQKVVVESDDIWRKIAALHRDESTLDEASISVIRREHPDAAVAGEAAIHKWRVEDPILRMVREFEESIALDTVKNEYMLHRRIHEWFISGKAPDDFDALNEKVYAELFLTPSSDPWLGLAPADVYTALDNGGLTPAESRQIAEDRK